MKKLILMLTILATISMTASAQRGQGRMDKDSKFAKELNLSTEQQEKMKTLNEEFKTKIAAVKSDESLTKESKRDKMKELMTAKRNQTQALLTPAQKSKIESMRENRVKASKLTPSKKRGHSGKKFADLNLTEAQKIQMKALGEKFRSEMKALKDDSALSKDAKDQKRKEMAVSHMEQVKSILTPEQQAKMKDHFSKDKKDSRRGGKKDRGNRKTANTANMSIS